MIIFVDAVGKKISCTSSRAKMGYIISSVKKLCEAGAGC